MIPHHIYYQLAIVGLLWLCSVLHYVWPSRDDAVVIDQFSSQFVICLLTLHDVLPHNNSRFYCSNDGRQGTYFLKFTSKE
jgi:hypothetical protein